MSKAIQEFDNASYQKCIQIVKEELKFHPKSKEALRILIKAHMRLYEFDKADEIYSKFFPLGQPEDALTKSIYIKETIFYDEAKARFMGKELQAQLEKMKFHNASISNAQQKDSQNLNQQSQHQQQNNLSTTYNHNNNNNNNNINNQSVDSEIIITSESLSFAKSILKFLDSQFDEAVNKLQNDIIQQGSLVNANLKQDAYIIMILSYNKQKQYKQSQTLIAELQYFLIKHTFQTQFAKLHNLLLHKALISLIITIIDSIFLKKSSSVIPCFQIKFFQ